MDMIKKTFQTFSSISNKNPDTASMVNVSPAGKQKAKVSFSKALSNAEEIIYHNTQERGLSRGLKKAYICFLKGRDETQVEMWQTGIWEKAGASLESFPIV